MSKGFLVGFLSNGRVFGVSEPQTAEKPVRLIGNPSQFYIIVAKCMSKGLLVGFLSNGRVFDVFEPYTAEKPVRLIGNPSQLYTLLWLGACLRDF